MKICEIRSIAILAAAFVLAACGGSTPTAAPAVTVPNEVAKASTDNKAAPVAAVGAQASPIATEAQPPAAAPTATEATVGEVAGVEGGGGEAALVTYADAAQGFSIDYPKPWTRDLAVKEGVKFVGDGTFILTFVKTDSKDVLAFATGDVKAFAASLPSFKQVGLDLSTEVKNAAVLGFETTGTSNVTGKTFVARGDRYYIALKDGRVAILTVITSVKNYDREGVRDMALTLKVTQ